MIQNKMLYNIKNFFYESYSSAWACAKLPCEIMAGSIKNGKWDDKCAAFILTPLMLVTISPMMLVTAPILSATRLVFMPKEYKVYMDYYLQQKKSKKQAEK